LKWICAIFFIPFIVTGDIGEGLDPIN
jgi:hypothetical protein